ncbi:MAG: hypothetical protein AB2754_20010 [Candidatus Thiodiazotropha endolucinida]
MSGIPKIDDINVQRIINQAIVKSAGSTITKKVGSAFRELRKRRREVEPLNIELAAAEHYMYARFLAGVTGDPLVEYAPTAYHIKKKIFMLLRIQERMQTTKLPMMPPREKLLQWGNRGAKDGLKDWEARNPGKQKNRGAALKVLSNEAIRY